MSINLTDFTVIIPCKNEIDFIEDVIDSVFKQDAFLRFTGEVIVVDGGSNDGTVELLASLGKTRKDLTVLDNPLGNVSPALNLGIKASSGRYIVRMDAHADYPFNYISSLIDYMEANSDVDNVGYAVNTIPHNNNLIEHSIAHVLSHKYGIGSALFRLSVLTPQVVDTVPFGCYRREIFERLGAFDVDLIRNQDDEFNGRIIKAKGKIVLLPNMKVNYFPRKSYSKLWAMYYQYGLFKPIVVRKLQTLVTLRQLAPPLLVLILLFLLVFSIFGFVFAKLFLLLTISLYLALSIIATKDVVSREYFSPGKDGAVAYWPYVLCAMITTHFSYGCGYLVGVVRMILGLPIASVKSSR